MKPFQSILAAALVAAAVCAPAQSFLDVADASLDALREGREQNAAPANVRAIFAKAKAAADEDDKLNLCGFYIGMSEADAQTLAGHYALKDGEWSTGGDPVYEIKLSLKGVRRVTKGGNTFDELAQAVANRVGSLKQDWETKEYRLNTIDGIFVTMSESSGFRMVDRDPWFAALQERQAAERKAREELEAEREAAERKAREEREAAERKAKEEARRVALDWKSESKNIPISDSVSIKLRSVPGNLWFGQYEVTQAQWEVVMGKKCEIPNYRSRYVGKNLPAVCVSFDDYHEFLEKLNALPSVKKSGLTFRLSTAEEWELACRAGATGKFCRLADGTEISESTLGQVAWFGEDEYTGSTHPVGQKQPNAFGLYDMHGNVQEAVAGSRQNYYGFRGGWAGDSARDCESSGRGREFYFLFHGGRDFGFRLCAEAVPKGKGQ